MSVLARTFSFLSQKYVNNIINKSTSRSFKWNQKCLFHVSALRNIIGQEIKMPSLSPTMTEGRIIKWCKKEGDTIKPGDLLCEIQTDKAVMAFETEEEGIIAKILVREDTDIKVGKLIALMVSEGEDWKSVELPGSSENSVNQMENITQTSSGGNVPGMEIKMPSLSPTMSEGTIIKWLKKEGDKISPGDGLCEVQTDKAVMVFETEEEGILAKILVPDNTAEVKVGTLIALIVEEGEDWKNVAIPKLSSEVPSKVKTPQTGESVIQSEATEAPLKAWPAVRLLLEKYRLDFKQIEPSGRQGILLKKDVLKYISDNNLSPKPLVEVPLPSSGIKQEFPEEVHVTSSPELAYIDIELSNVRRTIAKRLTQSKTEIPHAYSVMDSCVDDLLKSRSALKSAGINVSVNDFVIKAVAAALKECPYVNTLFLNNQVVGAPGIDIAVAVATPNGLITPIVRSADTKSITYISEEVRELAERARKGTLQLQEFQGGSFTISNLGMFGIREFSAIINPPQCGILAVGSGRQELSDNSKPITKMTCTLSFDERVIDQAGAAEFLSCVQFYLEHPSLILLSQNRRRIESGS